MGYLYIIADKDKRVTHERQGNDKVLYISGESQLEFSPSPKWENQSLDDAVIATLIEKVDKLKSEVVVNRKELSKLTNTMSDIVSHMGESDSMSGVELKEIIENNDFDKRYNGFD